MKGCERLRNDVLMPPFIGRSVSLKTILVHIPLVCFGVVWNIRYIIYRYHRRQQQHSWHFDSIDFDAPFPTRKKEFWEKRARNASSHCFHVDNICSSKRRGGWFYDNAASTYSTPLHQPSLSLYLNETELETTMGLEVKLDTRIQFSVSNERRYFNDDSTCTYSPISHHMVLHSHFNHMIGEYYSRAILGLFHVLQNVPSWSSFPDLQYYIHFVDRRNDLLDGHRLFLEGVSSHQTDSLKNFVSLMPLDPCRCYTKLIFCGYEKNEMMSRANWTWNITSPIVRVNETKDENAPINIRPGGMILGNSNKCNPPHCTDYRQLRRGLIKSYSLIYPELDEQIQQYRRKILIDQGLLLNNDTSSINQWKFVGLTHRKLRRIWLNIDEVISMCKRKFTKQHNVVCLTVNVEEATSPMEQLLMHRSLHALIGVHGAQLTQGVLLQNHAYIVELLPWVPDYLWGYWVASTHVPTPLGIIFLQTELNHLGYSLGRESVPYCLDSEDDEADKACLLNKTSGVRKKIRWDKRDFTVPVNAISTFLSRFLLQEVYATCEDVERRGNETNDFVLYNVYCKETSNATRQMIARQYYRNHT